MKKGLLTITALAVTFTLVSCGTNTASAEGIPSTETGLVKEKAEGGKSIHLTKSEFLEKVFNYEKNSEEWKFEGDIPCIVDFYADWCQPCKIAGPILDELAAEYEGRIHVYKVNTEKERELSAAFGIRSIPTFMLCPKEGQPQVFSGIGQSKEATKEMFKKAIDDVLLKTKTSN